MTRLINADALMEKSFEIEYADGWHKSVTKEVVSVKDINNAPTIELSGDIISKAEVLALINKAMYNTDNKDIQDYIFCGLRRDVHNLPTTRSSGDLISREELLKKLDRQIEWEEANAIPYEDADGGCILGLKKARKYVKLASSTEKPNANDCDLISRQDAIESIQNAYCKPCKERGDDHNEVRCRVCEYDNAIIQIDALPSANRPKGEWLDEYGNKVAIDDNGITERNCWCSVCDEWLVASDEYPTKGNFCPNCGADMRGGAK